MDTKVQSGPNVTADGTNVLVYTPKNAFTAWTTYQFPFGLTIGGGARYNGKLHRGTDGAVGTPLYIDAYWVVDAMASYRINKNVDIQLNLSTCSTSSTRRPSTRAATATRRARPARQRSPRTSRSDPLRPPGLPGAVRNSSPGRHRGFSLCGVPEK
jgi:outer membrane receptor for ferrienterochelin and colicin